MTPDITILLIDDHNLFRSGLRFLLEQESDLKVIGEASDGLEGVKLAEQLRPDVVLLDLDMPSMHGREALPQLLSDNPELAVIMLTVSEEAQDLIECMRIGAKGYLLKNIDTDFLLRSIRNAVAGDSVLSPEMTSKLVSQFKNSSLEKTTDEFALLTPREKEILSWIAKGISNKGIAHGLNLAESTVKVHVQHVLKKLNLKSRVQAAIYEVEKKYHL